MTIRGIRRFRRWVRNCFGAQALILVYHRVTNLASDPYLLAVKPQHFGEQMELLRRHYRPLRLHELLSALRSGRVPDRAVVVTFDDGYSDNLYNAKPLLERYDIPATSFVTAGHIGQSREFWWDELDKVLLEPGTLPSVFDVRLNGSAWKWELAETTTYTTAEYQRHQHWHIECEGDPTTRHRLHRALYRLLHASAPGHREELLAQVRTWAAASPISRPSHRTLSHDEVIQLAEGGLVEIGAHTVNHPVLADLPIDAQREEVSLSKAKIQDILNRPVTSFAYPHGSYTEQTLAIVRDAGFSSACSTHNSAVKRGADYFKLPRSLVRDWDGEQFEASLKHVS